MACKNCSCPEQDFPMCFRGEDHCSDNCRKELERKSDNEDSKISEEE